MISTTQIEVKNLNEFVFPFPDYVVGLEIGIDLPVKLIEEFTILAGNQYHLIHLTKVAYRGWAKRSKNYSHIKFTSGDYCTALVGNLRAIWRVKSGNMVQYANVTFHYEKLRIDDKDRMFHGVGGSRVPDMTK